MTTAVINIPVRDTAPAALPESLATRLNASPTKSPENLATELAKHVARTELLRNAHIEAIKDRAARDTQRVEEAAARKRRLAASQVAQVQRRLEAADTKVAAKREALKSKRAAWAAKRAEFANNVAEARRAAVAAKQVAHQQALEIEHAASSKHAKLIQAVHDKSASVVKHAAAVVAAQKEKEASATADAAAKLADRLAAAELRRDMAASPSPSSPPSPNSKAIRQRVLNDSKAEAQRRNALYSKRMDEAEAKRTALIEAKVEKAGSLNVAKQDKVLALQAKSKGLDAETAASKSALYGKLLNAEIARLHQLRKRTAGKWKGDTTSVIVVAVNKTSTVRMPPPALAKRLSTVGCHLTATSKARQAAAKSRRQGLRAAMGVQLAAAAAKRAAAVRRVASKRAAAVALLKANESRSLVAKAIADGRRDHVTSLQAKRAAAVLRARKASDASREEKGALADAHAKAVAERRDAVLRRVAKHGVVAVRAAAAKSRRSALSLALTKRAEGHRERCAKAAEAKAATLAEVVAKAKAAMALRTSDS